MLTRELYKKYFFKCESFAGDFGMLFLLRVLSDAQVPEEDLHKPILDEILRVMHCPLGDRLMLGWRMPELYRDIVKNHHQTALPSSSPVLNMVILADIMATRLDGGPELPYEGDLLATPQAKALNADKFLIQDLEKVLGDSAAVAGSI